ncbi:T9SS type A sorting domain-containing protein [Aureibaculum sp. 2210JD6-5]|uniref:T9SS type A sorting domain-containing protein n=1 Tax=Aureibaculum sp. 2210JD6-5 TaxID=3103957 RepID=UPI002AACBBA9|nr:T9SS type A sorting domain-containing protein [Aureibaculum sp. 2210JD6-5]MDY7393677.1 T9SS type A sorting domain-containing protein [Aureibaculum sp. 2210JD6-5]
MVKKLLLFILLVSLSLAVFAQQPEKNGSTPDSATVIKEIVASPNPFSVTTKIKFQANAVFEIQFSVKDLIGNVVYSQKYTTKKGSNSIPFYRDKLDSGIYIYSIKTNTEIKSKRIVIK